MAEPTAEELNRRILALQHENLLLTQDELKESVQDRKAKKIAAKLKLEAREKQLTEDNKQRVRDAKGCTHKQGGSMKRPMRGAGPTALKRTIMPDCEMIRCSVCRFTVFSPNRRDQDPEKRKDETKQQAEARVEKFHADTERFQRLLDEIDEGSITEESSAPMNCGMDLKFLDARGREVLVPRPSDSYALQY